jgi:hypothetical protein
MNEVAPLHRAATPALSRREDLTCRVKEWKPWPYDNPSLVGHCTVAFSEIPVFRGKDGALSVGVANAASIDGEGRVRVRDGKRQYVSIITFETNEARQRWQRMVLGALAAAGVGSATS